MAPPDLGRSVNRYLNQEGQIMPTTLHWHPRIFRPSYGPAFFPIFFYRWDGQSTNAQELNTTANYHAIDWTPLRAMGLTEFYNYAPLEMQCQSGSGKLYLENYPRKYLKIFATLILDNKKSC